MMEKENIGLMVDSALLNGIIESECMQCGTSLQCEPNATRA
jgi:hypothetical protein